MIRFAMGSRRYAGMRITVQTILEFILAGTPVDEILYQYPVLEEEDIEACKQFAMQLLDRKYTIKEIAA